MSWKWSEKSSVWPFPPPFLFSDLPACSPSPQFPTSCLAPHHYIQSNGTQNGLWFGLWTLFWGCDGAPPTARRQYLLGVLAAGWAGLWSAFRDVIPGSSHFTRWVKEKLAYRRLKVDQPKWIKSTHPSQRSVTCYMWSDFNREPCICPKGHLCLSFSDH